ncbi:PLP-dependent aminotransferase family protein [Paenibacillus ginsengihumi]|uniref:MocR-like pyridoxine biosynthesis transcription factor PdxR n=1 Tax=Paenibacillus ginsengihumi TaxID=431596 RepID=UPI000382BB7D|nr:PLP-dependent aminotransferase family protein [Paenibacillus ginsengihumi]
MMFELTPRFDGESAEALYMQLYRYIRGEIAAGRIKAGERLPSIRRLAAHLGVSRTPVALAYDQLLAEGYARSKPRSGLFAAELDAPTVPAMPAAPAAGPSPASAARPHAGPEAAPASAAYAPQRAYHAAEGERLRYDFGYGSVDLAHFPLVRWRRLMNRCLLPENSRLLLYGDWQGEPGLREEIAAYLHRMRGVRCTPGHIVVGAGTYHSLELLFQLLQEDVACIAAEEAVNEGVKALLGQYRFACRPLRLESDGIRIEDVAASGAQAAYVTPSHQFPFGMTLSAGKRIKLLNWAKERRAYIIENDYDGEFRYGGMPIPSLQSMDDDGRVIYVGTFSRALTPAFRISYLVLPDALLERFRRRRHSYDQLASPIFQGALQLFMQSGDFARHMRRMRTLYQRKNDALLQAVRSSFGELAELIGEGSGLHVLLRVHNGMSEAELVRTARREGAGVYPTSVYALNEQRAPASTVLLGFGGLSETDIREGVAVLARAWLAG